jgi:WD40 repeat protein
VVRLWDVASEKQAAALNGHADNVNCVWFGPGGKVLASAGGDGTITLWDVSPAEKKEK